MKSEAHVKDMPDILSRILRRKAEEVVECAQALSLADLSARLEGMPAPRGFFDALESKRLQGKPAVIAEIKRASPSKGLLRDPYEPAGVARSYARHGAACLSVLTDRDFFQGHSDHLREARAACDLPVLRKDFVIDPYQVYEARAMGADCVLLIVAALGDAALRELAGLAEHLDMDVLIEVHDSDELERALEIGPRLVGVNNRDLRTFDVDLETTLNLLDGIPEEVVVVTESGIHQPEDVARMRSHGVDTFLVGEAFMRAADPGARLAQLFSMESEA